VSIAHLSAQVGERLQALRAERKMSREYVSSQMSTVDGINWTPATVRDIELGKRDIRIQEFMVLCVVISADALELCPELAMVVA
jgi:transcriptional regulator with XRE-family HTH domain